LANLGQIAVHSMPLNSSACKPHTREAFQQQVFL